MASPDPQDVRHQKMNDFKRPDQEPDLEVEIDLLTTDQGGRKQPLWQGCRTPHDFGLPDEMNDGMYEFPDGPPSPGETARAFVWLLAPERNAGRLSPGREFKMWEGKIIAHGRILKVINKELRTNAGR